jgi:SAM-dependent methyltransferase
MDRDRSVFRPLARVYTPRALLPQQRGPSVSSDSADPSGRKATGQKADLLRLQRDWNDLARLDAMWSILSNRGTKYGRWSKENFMHTGSLEVNHLLSKVKKLGFPKKNGLALDFGCGVGRVSRYLAQHFELVVGVDISLVMLGKARSLNQDLSNLAFVQTSDPALSCFPPRSFDLIYCSRVLQHMPSEELASQYLSSLARLLAPEGLLYVQMPARIGLSRRILSRRMLYEPLRRLGVAPGTLYRVLGLHPMNLVTLEEREVLRILAQEDLQALEVEPDVREIYFYKEGHIYFATRPSASLVEDLP